MVLDLRGMLDNSTIYIYTCIWTNVIEIVREALFEIEQYIPAFLQLLHENEKRNIKDKSVDDDGENMRYLRDLPSPSRV